ncbi:hypothetical protein DL769_003045 [Monosporascus sp. CRB-8-3]|nr:hypothetical protein DL769_003045 [Monosporascus sp. CRB-8-3]
MPRVKQLYESFRQTGLDWTAVKALRGGTTKALLDAWGKDVRSCEATLYMEQLFLGIVEHFPLLNKPDELLGVLAERAPWTANVPNTAILSAFNTIVTARRKYNATNGPSEREETSLIVVVQRFIDLYDGVIQYEPDNHSEAWKRAKAPTREEQALFAREAANQDQRRQIEELQNECNYDDDELEENTDYPDPDKEDNDHVTMVDPDVGLVFYDPRTGLPASPKPANKARSGRNVNGMDISKRSKSTGTTAKTGARVKKARKKASKKPAPGEKNIFQDFWKGVPKPVILPIEPSPSTRPPPPRFTGLVAAAGIERTRQGIKEMVIGMKPHPESETICKGLDTITVNKDTKKKLPPKIPQPKTKDSTRGVFLPPMRVKQVLHPHLKNEDKKERMAEEKEDDEEDGLFVE